MGDICDLQAQRANMLSAGQVPRKLWGRPLQTFYTTAGT